MAAVSRCLGRRDAGLFDAQCERSALVSATMQDRITVLASDADTTLPSDFSALSLSVVTRFSSLGIAGRAPVSRYLCVSAARLERWTDAPAFAEQLWQRLISSVFSRSAVLPSLSFPDLMPATVTSDRFAAPGRAN